MMVMGIMVAGLRFYWRAVNTNKEHRGGSLETRNVNGKRSLHGAA
jgi:hypothetical protein